MEWSISGRFKSFFNMYIVSPGSKRSVMTRGQCTKLRPAVNSPSERYPIPYNSRLHGKLFELLRSSSINPYGSILVFPSTQIQIVYFHLPIARAACLLPLPMPMPGSPMNVPSLNKRVSMVPGPCGPQVRKRLLHVPPQIAWMQGRPSPRVTTPV